MIFNLVDNNQNNYKHDSLFEKLFGYQSHYFIIANVLYSLGNSLYQLEDNRLLCGQNFWNTFLLNIQNRG